MLTRELDILVRTIYGEARGEPIDGKVGVAWTIRNRVSRPRWWGGSYAEVCLKPKMFSCWDDKNRIAMMSASYTTGPSFRECVYVALSVYEERIPDPTNGADHYHARYVAPSWADPEKITAEIYGHIFYRLED